MKNAIKIASAVIFVLLIPFSGLSAQEKKTEKKIKIITNDGSGNHVVIDTVFAGNGPDSLKLKDGSVVYLKHDDDLATNHNDGKHQIMIASTNNGGNDVIKEITVFANDSSDSHNGVKGDVMMYNNSSSGGTMSYKIVRKSDGADNADHVYYMNKDSDSDQNNDTFKVFVSTDDHDAGIDKSRYVIAKDGIVVTVEGTDKAKTEALAKEIREKLGVKTDSDKKKSKK